MTTPAFAISMDDGAVAEFNPGPAQEDVFEEEHGLLLVAPHPRVASRPFAAEPLELLSDNGNDERRPSNATPSEGPGVESDSFVAEQMPAPALAHQSQEISEGVPAPPAAPVESNQSQPIGDESSDIAISDQAASEPFSELALETEELGPSGTNGPSRIPTAAETIAENPVADGLTADDLAASELVTDETASPPLHDVQGIAEAAAAESEPADDRDMSAVEGVSAVAPESVAEIAAAIDGVSDRLDPGAGWTVPVSVFAELEPLGWDCETGQWARETADAVNRLVEDLAAESPRASRSVKELLERCRQGVTVAESMEGTKGFDQMRHVLNVLHRRVNIWQQIALILDGTANQPGPVDWARFGRSVANIQRMTARGGNGAAWSEFLELDALSHMAAGSPDDLTEEDRTTARVIVLKLRAEDVTDEQREFLRSLEATNLAASLAELATEPLDAERLLQCVEAYERTGSPMAAELLAIERLELALSTLPAHVELARQIEEFYNGANVRIAVTGYLLNRMMPDRQPEYQWVRDEMLGHPVAGRSYTSAEVGLALIPDSQKMRAALTVDGLVEAATTSTAGPAEFVNHSESSYSAVKELELTPEGIHFQPTEVNVENEIQLRRVRTEFDGIPLVGSLVSSVARSQHEKSRPAIRREMKRKIQRQAEQQIDEEIEARLGELNGRLKHRLLDPLAEMALRPRVTEAVTTAARMSMQLQLAAPSQLGSHTPRPWAPSDSVLSFQMHQSALNNILSRLQFDGATMTIKELRARIADRFNRPEMLEEASEHDDVLVTFASRDAARIDFEDGRVVISLGIRRLRAGGRQWGAFRVLARYRAEVDGQSAYLTRDGVVELMGRIRAGSQIALRGIFSKTFAKDQVLPIVPEKVSADPRLQGLEVTQLNVDNGWFALAIGPERLQTATGKGSAAVR